MSQKNISILSLILISACASNPNVASKNPAEVTFQFMDTKNLASLTFWRKIESNGNKGDRFSVGVPTFNLVMNTNFPTSKPETITLDPGTYYLDSFQVGNTCVSQSGHFKSRNGWDDNLKKPLYLSFSVKEGQKLTLPVVTFKYDCETASFKDPKKIFTTGNKLKIN